jgi:pimeloyl-ACP methyl ester carboxylesterase
MFVWVLKGRTADRMERSHRSGRKTRLIVIVTAVVATVTVAMPANAAPHATRAVATTGGNESMESASTELASCDEDPTFLCGTVPVPLDRRHPDGRMVNLHVEVFPHTGARERADGAVFVTCGGPGCSATLFPKYGFSFFVLPQVAETRDLVFVDQRGVGLSDVIDCPGVQAGGPLYASAAACHDQLGDTANLYSTTDVADDLDDVRAALGYDRIDLFGGSYAGNDMITYTVRHTEHVRSVVLASPAMVVGTDPFWSYAPEAMPRIVAGVCGRSPACAAANPDPQRSFARLARQLREHPVSGVGVDSAGAAREVTVSENLLSNFIMYFNGAHFTGPGEILPAAAAARRGDLVPLLRLAADANPSVEGSFSTDLREFSNGHSLARSCVDGVFPFDKTAPAAERQAQFAGAYAAEPDAYGPISKSAWAAPDYLGFQPSPCIVSEWEDRPMYPAGTRVDGVPTLILGGEYDLPVPESVSRLAADVLVDSTYVSMTAAGHDPQFWSDCGPELTQRFIVTLETGDTSCADQPAGGWWVPGSFPTTTNQAPQATQTGGPKTSPPLRRLVTVAAWTVMDGVQHNFFVGGDSVGLRGGTVQFEPLDNAGRWTLDGARFTNDVTVDGVVTGTFPIIDADVTVHGPQAHADTTMHLNGAFLVDGEDLTITTTVDGETATFTVPAY